MSLKMTDSLADDGVETKGKAKNPKNTGGVQDTVAQPQADQAAYQAAAATAGTEFNLLNEIIGANYTKDLSPDGDKYLQYLITNAQKAEVGYKVIPASNLHMFYKNKNVVGLLFAENIPSYEKASTDMAISTAYKDFEVSGIAAEIGQLAEVIVVFQQDYQRTSQMMRKIINATRYATSDDIAFGLMEGAKFRVNTNLGYVRKVIDEMCPHAVPSRVDFGLVLEILNDRDASLSKMHGIRREMRYETVAVVGGYADIIKTAGRSRMQDRFLPLIHISEVQSNLQTIRLLPLLMGLAVDAFYQNMGWMAPFMSFTANEPNLGQLYWVPETGKPDFLTNRDQLNNFCNDMLEEPVMMMDIQPGRSSIPGMALLITPFQQALVSLMTDFFNKPGNRSFEALSKVSAIIDQPVGVLTGVVEHSGQKIDSRYIDYFALVNQVPDRALLERFLMYTDRPEDRLEAIEAAGFRSILQTYTTAMAPINMAGLGAILTAMSEHMLDIQVDYTHVQSAMNANAMMDRSRSMRDMVSSYGPLVGSRYQQPGATFYVGQTAWGQRRF